MTGAIAHSTTIAGIVIPSTSPVFLGLIGAHVLVALVTVIAGLVAMFSPKRPGRHPRAGSVYYWSLTATVAVALVLSAMRWPENLPLAILGALAFASATVGRTVRRRWPARVRLHIAGMGGSYVLMLTAFYVDNRKNLPLRKELPAIVYWLLPAAVGIPLIAWSMAHHPVAGASSSRRARLGRGRLLMPAQQPPPEPGSGRP